MNELRRQPITGGVILAFLAAFVTACGGAGGSSPSASPSSTARTTFVTGVITGFGSVIVNGVHFESDSATVTLEGQPGTVGDLEVGEVVHLKATTDAQGNMHATSIDQERLIQGVVDAVDTVGSTLTVEGQLILVDNETSFDESIPGRSLAGIVVGDRLEIHGFAGAGGEAHATRIEKADAGDDEIEVTGPIVELDATHTRFSVGNRVVDYSTASLQGFPASGPALGDMIEAKGTTLLPDGALKAVTVSLEDGDIEGHAGDGAELEGLVTRFASVTDFDVSGHKVTTTGSTVFVGGTSADLALDAMVEVEGELNGEGTLVAEKVVSKHESTVTLAAPVEAVDAGGGTLQLLGVTVMVSLDTSKEDNEAGDHFFALDDVHVGDWVEVSGYPDPAGSGKLVATRLERDHPAELVELRGIAVEFADSTFSIAGVSVATTADTTFEAGGTHVGAGDFYALAVGQVVEVSGTWSGVAPLVAATAEIVQSEDDHAE